MSLKGLKIGFALTGSFCTIEEALIQMEKIKNEGAEIFPIVSEIVFKTDTRFGKASDNIDRIEKITGKKVVANIVDAEPIGPKVNLDILVVLPCTGNTTAKIANAVTDTSVTMAVKAHLRNLKPVVLSIATNDGLSNNAKNIGKVLNMKNVYVVPFGQDDPQKKPNSLIAKTNLIIPTIEHALSGKQIEPVLV